jgi:hypothetical protein
MSLRATIKIKKGELVLRHGAMHEVEVKTQYQNQMYKVNLQIWDPCNWTREEVVYWCNHEMPLKYKPMIFTESLANKYMNDLTRRKYIKSITLDEPLIMGFNKPIPIPS